jgi:hypothetical protein
VGMESSLMAMATPTRRASNATPQRSSTLARV